MVELCLLTRTPFGQTGKFDFGVNIYFMKFAFRTLDISVPKVISRFPSMVDFQLFLRKVYRRGNFHRLLIVDKFLNFLQFK